MDESSVPTKKRSGRCRGPDRGSARSTHLAGVGSSRNRRTTGKEKRRRQGCQTREPGPDQTEDAPCARCRSVGELFAGGVSPVLQRKYISALGALVKCERVFVIAILRSGFYADCQQFPEFVELTALSGKYELQH